MNLNSIISLLGGLGAFLFGMHYMGEGLELAAGNKMKDLLEKLPLVNQVVKLTYKIIPIQEHESEFRLKYLDKNMIGSPVVMTLQVEKEVCRLADIVRHNLDMAATGLVTQDLKNSQLISDNEEVIDYLTGEITEYLTKASVAEMPANVSE